MQDEERRALEAKALELGTRGAELVQQGRPLDALEIFKEAASYFDPDDRSAEAASAFHDYAEQLQRTDRWKTDLPMAVTLFERALKSPARQADPVGHIATLTGLSVCLRKLATKPGNDKEELIALAIQRAKEAQELLPLLDKSQRPVLTVSVSGALGNAYREAGHYGKAIKAYQLAVEHAWSRGPSNVLLASLLVATARIERGEKGDLKAAVKALNKVLDTDPGHPLASLLLAKARLSMPRLGKKAARQTLRRLDVQRLQPEHAHTLAEVSLAAGWVGPARRVLQQLCEKLRGPRSQAVSDRDSDLQSDRLQQVAWELAKLDLAARDQIAAFLTFENTSGLRYLDRLIEFGKSRLPARLDALLQQQGHGSTALQFLSEFSRVIPMGRDLPGWLDELLQHIQQEDEPVRKLVEPTLRLARAKPPQTLSLFKREADRLKRHVEEINGQLMADPAYARLRTPGDTMTRQDLAATAAKHPDTVFLHASAREGRLVAVGAWWEGEGVVTGLVDLALPDDVVRVAVAHPPAQSPEVAAALASVDLRPALGPTGKERLVILPGGAAARIPLDACGPAGHTALDRFASICWMPVTLGLEIAPPAAGDRKGTVGVAPPVTHLADEVFEGLGMSVLKGQEATAARCVEEARNARVLALYTHGNEFDQERMTRVLELADGPFEPNRSLEVWAGMDRVELWACASGANWSIDMFAPTADELYGMDADLLLAGVATVIGTFWPVSQLVTACIARHFHSLVGQGVRPDKALRDAKVWWRDEGGPLMAKEIEADGDEGARRALAQLHLDALVDAKLAPVEAQEAAVELREQLLHPVAWSGFRFLGVCR